MVCGHNIIIQWTFHNMMLIETGTEEEEGATVNLQEGQTTSLGHCRNGLFHNIIGTRGCKS